jgi:hypothetical protein
MKHITIERRCEDVALKHGWRFSRVDFPVSALGKHHLDYYKFEKDDVVFTFNQRQGSRNNYGNDANLKIAGLECNIRILFYPNPVHTYRSPSALQPAEYAESVLSRFDRNKLLDEIQKQAEKRVHDHRQKIIEEEKLLQSIQAARR